MPSPARLLLAEDDPVSRSFLAQALADGHDLRVAVDGPAALRLAAAERFDLLLLDLNLPGLRGPELLALLRADPRAASCLSPALALTADPDQATRQSLVSAGFVAVLGKPVSIALLRDTVRGLLGGARIATPAAHDTADATRLTADLPDWDDAAALRSANGDPAIVAALRQLLLAELPGQCRRIITAVDSGDTSAARGDLHRLRAASGFCGAVRLAANVDRLAASLTAPSTRSGPDHVDALQQFEHAVQALHPEFTPVRAAPAH